MCNSVSYWPQLFELSWQNWEHEKNVSETQSPCFKLKFSFQRRIISARITAAGHGDRGTKDTGSKPMGSNRVGLPSFGPVIWTKKSCRHLYVVSCQGGEVVCHITHGERGWETSGGEDKKESELYCVPYSECVCVSVCMCLCTLMYPGWLFPALKGRHSSVFQSPQDAWHEILAWTQEPSDSLWSSSFICYFTRLWKN